MSALSTDAQIILAVVYAIGLIFIAVVCSRIMRERKYQHVAENVLFTFFATLIVVLWPITMVLGALLIFLERKKS